MLAQIRKHKWFIIVLFFSVFMAFSRFHKGEIQQDNYVGYAGFLPLDVSNISFYDSRLLPRLPILIYLLHFVTGNYYVAGYLLTLVSVAGCYYLLYKLTKTTLSFLPLVFPPIMLNLASLIDTEFPFIFLTLLALFLFKKQSYKWAFLLVGVSIWFRLSGLAILSGIFIFMLAQKQLKRFLVNLPYFLIPVSLLCLYNVYYFGSQNPLYQIFAYEALHPSRISFGIIQLLTDIVRAARWHWYRILISGIFYTAFYFWVYWKSAKSRGLEFWILTAFYIFTLGINLVPFLENLGRYLAHYSYFLASLLQKGQKFINYPYFFGNVGWGSTPLACEAQ